MGINLNQLQQHVQHNCHISDAVHAGQYTLCIYLMKMREYFRWEKALGFQDQIDNNVIGHWLTQRETLWENLEASPFTSLIVGDDEFEPFDIDGKIGIGQYLVAPEVHVHGLVIGDLRQHRRHRPCQPTSPADVDQADRPARQTQAR